MKIRASILILFSALLLSCGTAPRLSSMLAIGNSITQHDPDPSIGWSGDWGMAASSQANDWAHLTAARFSLPVAVRNFRPLELDPADTSLIDALPDTAHTVVVLQLGENVASTDLAAFDAAYLRLGERVHPAACISTWWNTAEVDAIIQKDCQAVGGVYVYVGDLRTSPDNPDYAASSYTNPFVNAHPHDWGHRKIAERVAAALQLTLQPH